MYEEDNKEIIPGDRSTLGKQLKHRHRVGYDVHGSVLHTVLFKKNERMTPLTSTHPAGL